MINYSANSTTAYSLSLTTLITSYITRIKHYDNNKKKERNKQDMHFSYKYASYNCLYKHI